MKEHDNITVNSSHITLITLLEYCNHHMFLHCNTRNSAVTWMDRNAQRINSKDTTGIKWAQNTTRALNTQQNSRKWTQRGERRLLLWIFFFNITKHYSWQILRHFSVVLSQSQILYFGHLIPYYPFLMQHATISAIFLHVHLLCIFSPNQQLLPKWEEFHGGRNRITQNALL